MYPICGHQRFHSVMDHRGTRSRSICTRGRWKPLETRPINSLGSCTAFWYFPSNGADGAHSGPFLGDPLLPFSARGNRRLTSIFFFVESDGTSRPLPGSSQRGSTYFWGHHHRPELSKPFFLPPFFLHPHLSSSFSSKRKEKKATPSSLDSSAKRFPFSFTASHQGKLSPSLPLPLVYPNPRAPTASCACVGGRRPALFIGVRCWNLLSILLLLAGSISRRGSIAA
jgi:hypothetical protein